MAKKDKSKDYNTWYRPLKDLAYRIVSNRNVAYKGGANKEDKQRAIEDFWHNSPIERDDNKHMFIYGDYRPEVPLGEAYDWQPTITENNYKSVPVTQGIINPYNEYIFNERDRGLIEALAKARYTPTININDEYSDPESHRFYSNVPYFDDVHGYRARFHLDKNGKPVISSSDLWDFGKNYSEDFTDLYHERGGEAKNLESQRKWLERVSRGPYRLVQTNIPIRFVSNPQGDDIWRANNATNLFLDALTDDQIAEMTQTGYIQPSVVTNKFGGSLKRVESGKSGIHIKPENKGKFTETKKRTGKTTEELTHSKNPLTRKRAIFAQNAKHWNKK